MTFLRRYFMRIALAVVIILNVTALWLMGW